jgi:hypothetical protein
MVRLGSRHNRQPALAFLGSASMLTIDHIFFAWLADLISDTSTFAGLRSL